MFPFIGVDSTLPIGRIDGNPLLCVKGKGLSCDFTQGKPLVFTEGDWCSRTAPSESLGRFFQLCQQVKTLIRLSARRINLGLLIPYWNALGAIYFHTLKVGIPRIFPTEKVTLRFACRPLVLVSPPAYPLGYHLGNLKAVSRLADVKLTTNLCDAPAPNFPHRVGGLPIPSPPLSINILTYRDVKNLIYFLSPL